ncbi:hypothetical protein LCGC14_1714770 [marine sediment metagenome]|uniref:HTH cro/C1-type domain-containing protein n=1 Tax=marine sediment metagenome TaxID=412755 RepID=A0A0F9JUP8_9ZZZZ
MVLQKELKTLRNIRREKNVTQIQIFKKTKIWMSKISGIENGFLKANNEEKKLIARFLKVPVNSIDWGNNG